MTPPFFPPHSTHAPDGKFSHQTRGLEGKTIVDCSILLPGPFVAKLLALQGARVIKIENPDRPDPARLMGAYYQDLNCMKEERSIDITSSDGRKEFHEIIRESHGLIEGFRPSTKAKLGLDETTLHAINPQLVIGSIIGFPENGPWRDKAGHDLNFQATTGLLSLSHDMPPLPWADLFASYQAALSITSLLCAQSQGAKGQRVTVSMSEALIEIQSLLFAQFQQDKKTPHHGGNLFSGAYPCYRIYNLSENRRISVGCIEPKFWHRFCLTLGTSESELKELLEGQFATGESGEKTVNKLQSILSKRTWNELGPQLEALDCCVEPIIDYREVTSNHLSTRENET